MLTPRRAVTVVDRRRRSGLRDTRRESRGVSSAWGGAGEIARGGKVDYGYCGAAANKNPHQQVEVRFVPLGPPCESGSVGSPCESPRCGTDFGSPV